MKSKLRILIAENAEQETSAAVTAIYRESAAGVEISSAATVATLLAAIAKFAPDVVLLELSLAYASRAETVRRIHRAAPNVPLILVAEPTEREEAMQCLREGALDCLVKGSLDAASLERALRTALERNTVDVLTDLLRDPLTSVYTRDGFSTIGERKMASARRTGGTLVLVCLLLENLESLRERHGESAAESALLDLAELLVASFRRSDIVGRIGPAQFALLAVDAAEPSTAILRQRIERHVMARNTLRARGQGLEVRFKAKFWQGEDNASFAELLNSLEFELRGVPMTEVAR
ncbi:MAG TPA: diguanylate cyclase [Candidatus Acidoferrales bacterium]|nr:diguanylate cyclase [Candidatus Acidoferrales bacterium]